MWSPYIDIEHIVLKCPVYSEERTIFKIKNNLHEALNNKTECLNLIKFIDTTGFRHAL